MALDMNAAVRITASVNGQSAVDQLRNSMDKMSTTAVGLGKTLAAGFVGLQAIQGVSNFALSVLNAADQMDEMAQRTGLTVEQLSELEYAARLGGTSIDAVQTAMGKLAAKATDAATGNKTAQQAFDALGISVVNASGALKSQLELFEEVGQQIAAIQDPTLRAALAIEVFGKSGAQLLPLLQDMNKLRQEARELGGVIGADFAASAAQFNDNMDRMAFMSRGLAKAIMNEVLPTINRMMTEMMVGMKVFGSFGSAMLNIGTTNPFLTIEENAKKYNDRVVSIEAQIRKTEAAQGRWKETTLAGLREKLESAKKLAEYFNTIAESQRPQAVGQPTAPNAAADSAARRALDVMTKSRTATVQLTDAQREAKRQEQERAQILQQLRDSLISLRDGETELTLEKLRRLGASQKEIEQAATIIAQKDILNDALENEKENTRKLDEVRRQFLKDGQDRMRESAQAAQELAQEGKRVWEATRTPLEQYNLELERLNDLLQKGAISQDTYQRAAAAANEDLKSSMEKNKSGFQELEMAMLGFARNSADAFVDFVSGSKVSFSELVSSMLRDLARLAVYQSIMKPLFSWASGFLPGAPVANANGNVFLGGNIQAFANGGIVSGPTLFPMANGTGLMGEAGPEAIMPLSRTPSGKLGVIAQGGGTNNVTVNVNVESGQSTTDANGMQAQKLGGYIAKAVQAELLKQKRPGGVLFAGA